MIIKTDKDTIQSYLEDSSNLGGGHAERVVLPESIDEISAVLKEADLCKTPVTISGGGTGTTGSRIPFGGIALSMERINRIIGFSGDGLSCDVQAGALVEELKGLAEKKGLVYTSHPTEKTAFVGGTIATNASGARSFKYGPTRKYVTSLKMVLAGGGVLDIKRGEKFLKRGESRILLDSGRGIGIPVPSYRMPRVKNSAGYFAGEGTDLIDLFIGQEGTLSVIVEARIGLVRKPGSIFSCFAFFKKEEDAWSFSAEAKDAMDALSLEYFDSNALGFLTEKAPNIPGGARAAIFFEQETRAGADDTPVGEWLEIIEHHGGSMDDTWVAMNEKEADAFTGFRYAIPESVNDIIRRSGYQKLSTDIAVPCDKFFEMMRFYKDSFKDAGIRHVIFGHIGECHVHVNMLPGTAAELEKAKEMSLAFVKKGVSLGGTVSAEHGIGKLKHAYLEEMYGRKGVLEMAAIKKALDPNRILGRDNIFPKEILK